MTSRSRFDPRLVMAAAIGVLLLSVPYDLSSSMVPFYSFWGLDLQNLHAFHHCALRNAPYASASAGFECGDYLGRPMNYPPLLYWSFAWMRLMTFVAARFVWTLFVLAATYCCTLLFLPRAQRSTVGGHVFSLLLLLQFPMLYAIERGNSDALVLVLWAAMLLAARRARYGWAGAAAGAAIAMKLYPAFAVAIVACALLRDRRRIAHFVAGAAATVAGTTLLFASDWIAYLPLLRAFAAERSAGNLTQHGLPSFFDPVPAALLTAILLGSWALTALRGKASFDAIAAGGLAVATFPGGVSNDYNLITAYPLFAVLLARAATGHLSSAIAMLGLMLTITGPRLLFAGQPAVHVLAMIAALLFAAVAVAMRPRAFAADE
jgi:hypothetical protein